jgi:hypothetical protein
MGNRAVLTIDRKVGVYIHWNGGPESVTAFLDACIARGYRDPASDPSAALARLTGLLCEFFGVRDDGNVGLIALTPEMEFRDNGLYVIGKGWLVVEWTEGEVEDLYNQVWIGEQREVHDNIVESLTCN